MSWQLAKFIEGPRKGDTCWLYLTNERTEGEGRVSVRSQPFFAVKIQVAIPQAGRIVAINYHCAAHYPGRLHGARLDWLELQPQGKTSVELEDVCLGEELEREMFGDGAAANEDL